MWFSGYTLVGTATACTRGLFTEAYCVFTAVPLQGSPPTTYTHPTAYTYTPVTLAFLNGVKLNRQSGADSVKVIAANGDCAVAGPAPGSVEIRDLGPDDQNDQSTATATVTLAAAGSFRVCYRRLGDSYSAVEPPLAVAGATDATLSRLEFNQTGYSFDDPFQPSVTGYSITVPYTVERAAIAAFANHPDATLRAGLQSTTLQPLASGSTYYAEVPAGTQITVQVQVVAQDGINSKLYEVFVVSPHI